MKQNRLKSFVTGALLSTALTLTACGPQAFVPSTTTNSQEAAGGMNIPPKVDIVLGVSSNGTMRNIITAINSEVPGFLSTLQNSGWDYRFISIPLSEHHPVDPSSYSINGKVSVSNYDANYTSTWLAPYPGADHDTSPKVAATLFSSIFNVTTIAPSDEIDNHESGFDNQLTFLNRADVQANFLRPDAMLAVLTLSNADDRSDWIWGTYGTSQQGDYNPAVVTPSYISYYSSKFRAVKNNSGSALKYFSMVAHENRNCRGAGSWSGIHYEALATALNGQSVDICSNTVGASLQVVANNLQTYRLTFRKKYLVIANEPNVGTISVTKYSGGTSSTIPQDPTNGWTYVGAVPAGGVYTIDSPIAMDQVYNGYLIELHGTAKLNGAETADVNYQNAGTVSSH